MLFVVILGKMLKMSLTVTSVTVFVSVAMGSIIVIVSPSMSLIVPLVNPVHWRVALVVVVLVVAMNLLEQVLVLRILAAGYRMHWRMGRRSR